MGRLKKPSNILEASGAFKKHPERRKEREGELTDDRALGRAPAHLTPDQKKCWKELANNAVPGTLAKSDRAILECAAVLLDRARKQSGGDEIRRKLLFDEIRDADLAEPEELRHVLISVVQFADQRKEFKSADQSNLTSLLARCGFSPSDRARVQGVGGGKKESGILDKIGGRTPSRA